MGQAPRIGSRAWHILDQRKSWNGKSTLMKQLVTSYKKTSKFMVASFCFSAGGAVLERSTLGLFRSLIHTLFKEHSPIRPFIMDRYRSKRETVSFNIEWHEAELEEILQSIFSSQYWVPITISIDALDECDIDDMENLVEMFTDLVRQQPEFRLCVASRHYHNIRIPTYY